MKFYFKLEPVVNVFNKKVKGYEILSSPDDPLLDTELFFNSLSSETLETIFFEQLHFFFINISNSSNLIGNLFINAPTQLLTTKEFVPSIQRYAKSIRLNIEVQYNSNILNSDLLNSINNRLSNVANIWIDDINLEAGKKFELIQGVGLKIDKHAFWGAYKENAEMYSLYMLYRDNLIVEGIENNLHLQYLKKNNITFAQGYYWPPIHIIHPNS